MHQHTRCKVRNPTSLDGRGCPCCRVYRTVLLLRLHTLYNCGATFLDAISAECARTRAEECLEHVRRGLVRGRRGPLHWQRAARR